MRLYEVTYRASTGATTHVQRTVVVCAETKAEAKSLVSDTDKDMLHNWPVSVLPQAFGVVYLIKESKA